MSSKEALFPKMHFTMNHKWDISKTSKVFLWAGDTPLTLIGFSNVAQILKCEHIVKGEKTQVRKTTHFLLHCVNDSLMTCVICEIFYMVSGEGHVAVV